MSKIKINVNECIWFVILGGFAYYIYDLLSTDRILLFIHPKMLKYVYFSLFVLILLAGVQLRRITRAREQAPLKMGYILFLIPLFLGFAVNPQGLNGDVAAKKGMTLNQSNKGSMIIQTGNMEGAEIVEDGIIAFHDGDFVYILEEIYGNMEKYQGNQVIISGFIFRAEGFQSNEFVVARLLMNCCAADAQVVGLLCKMEELEDFEKDQWVQVKGTLKTAEHVDPYSKVKEIVPMIQVEQIERIEKPATSYVYP